MNSVSGGYDDAQLPVRDAQERWGLSPYLTIQCYVLRVAAGAHDDAFRAYVMNAWDKRKLYLAQARTMLVALSCGCVFIWFLVAKEARQIRRQIVEIELFYHNNVEQTIMHTRSRQRNLKRSSKKRRIHHSAQ